ncbi:MAG: SpoIVB peptidase [Fusicatenibacter sp.]|nr:SpoIVB peptidase [Lachnospiraceae bacterium]MDY2939041.1 SpoIVB peptidase [Fusicatenibacter sp.]
MTGKRKYRRILLVVLAILLVFGVAAGYQALRDSLPDQLYIDRNQEEPLKSLTEHPLVTVSESTEVWASDGTYYLTCRIGNIIPLKDVKVIPTTRQQVNVCGVPVGIYMETDGIMVIDTAEISTSDGLKENPAENIVQPGDYLKSVNGKKLQSKRELSELVKESDGSPMELLLERNGEEIKVKVKPMKASDGEYKLGIWVRDNIQGIGTLTYVEQDGRFGALGHGVSDMDTGEILHLGEGELYLAEILQIAKGQEGLPGELQGVIHYEEKNRIGVITGNSGLGISGRIDLEAMDMLPFETMEIGYKQELEKGPAQIMVCVDGEVRSYDAQITEIHMNAHDTNKGFTLQVTDPELIQRTGGIVQGMSGSPIIQDGKLVGAVTHVLVNDPTRGYGIFIENMLDAAE